MLGWEQIPLAQNLKKWRKKKPTGFTLGEKAPVRGEGCHRGPARPVRTSSLPPQVGWCSPSTPGPILAAEKLAP